MTEITKEAIEAGYAAYMKLASQFPAPGTSLDDFGRDCFVSGLSAALPFLAPIAGEGKVKALDWSNFEGPTINKDWKPDDQDLIYTALNFVSGDYGDKDDNAGEQLVELLLTAWRASLTSSSSPCKDGGQEVEAVAWLRNGEMIPIQGCPHGAMWITDKDDPLGFPVYASPCRAAPVADIKPVSVPEDVKSAIGISRSVAEDMVKSGIQWRLDPRYILRLGAMPLKPSPPLPSPTRAQLMRKR
ncbi:hypothetical protein B0E45_01280 [Sinorhizobium sp. A49]|uniref:hypothetical protein n=1 Tax=Sinorhizobium sp. A49 TaxID=1945861 RepID=UPI000986042C|nr:hypothetical protein [Sinorhizobium sp. A49]OOG75590.1 hypothetical protein B0E45_01280 [Sinorhizobium sp. A49]